MKVKELIELLQKQDPEKEVLISQGQDSDYIIAISVKEVEVCKAWDEDDVEKVVVIDYV